MGDTHKTHLQIYPILAWLVALVSPLVRGAFVRLLVSVRNIIERHVGDVKHPLRLGVCQ